ncbi:hypothetical protein [Solimonas marina]|uniref:Outer membrane protein beta-barrel domain-containing protein n=1 Tax=Solimonas marina TaxID=2714601 RepID=A0A970B8L8_9GAMM|nr:hypothetical protein [Solimonas marina]NKF21516.1 hypothetical protein [Solimonas marina]
MRKHCYALVPLLCAPAWAWAQQTPEPYSKVIPVPEQPPAVEMPSGAVMRYPPQPAAVDLFYVPNSRLSVKADINGDGVTDQGHIDDDGYGVRTLIPIGRGGMRIGGEYQAVKYVADGLSTDFKEYRLGGGWMSHGRLRGGPYVEYLNLDFGHGESSGGVGVHARGEYDATAWMEVYGQGGYLHTDHHGDAANGYEYLAGLSMTYNPWFGAFAEYRGSELKNNGDHTKFGDIRIGIKLLIGP